MTLAYVASPYTRFPGGLARAYYAARVVTGKLIKAGVHCYSPIVHSHPLCRAADIDPLDLSIWYPNNETMMERCDTLIVAHLQGWDTSDGVAREIDYFTKAAKPVFDLDPETLSMVRR